MLFDVDGCFFFCFSRIIFAKIFNTALMSAKKIHHLMEIKGMNKMKSTKQQKCDGRSFG